MPTTNCSQQNPGSTPFYYAGRGDEEDDDKLCQCSAREVPSPESSASFSLTAHISLLEAGPVIIVVMIRTVIVMAQIINLQMTTIKPWKENISGM